MIKHEQIRVGGVGIGCYSFVGWHVIHVFGVQILSCVAANVDQPLLGLLFFKIWFD